MNDHQRLAQRFALLLAAIALPCAVVAAEETPDLTGFYTSPNAVGPPPVLSPDGVTFVPSTAPPFTDEDRYTRMNCIPDTAFGYNPYGDQLIQTPGRLTWINQYNHIVRRIDIDQPRPKRIKPSFTGYSAGHWEGKVLVVETTALRKIQVRGAPTWASVERIIERIRKLDDGRLERVIRFEAITPEGKPSTLTTRSIYALQPDEHLYEYICEDAAGRFGDAEY